MKPYPILLLLALFAPTASGQMIVFNNRVFGEVVSPIYGPELVDNTLALQGNSVSGTPAGAVAYSGTLLAGATYSAELWAGPLGTPESSLTPVPGAITQFRTDHPGFIDPNPSVVSIPNLTTGDRATLQLRVWENSSASSWGDVLLNPTVLRGFSTTFDSLPLGGPNLVGPDTLPPFMVGLTSFNVHTAVPEPSVMAGAIILLGFAIGRFARSAGRTRSSVRVLA